MYDRPAMAGEPIQERIDFTGGVRLRPRAAAIVPDGALAARLARALRLSRPLVFLDLEATGIDTATDRIVEVSAVRIEPGGGRSTIDTLVDPGVPIPAEATAVHRIRDADVAGAPTLAEIGASLLRLLREADLAGFNLERYDLPLLDIELDRAGLVRPRAERIVDVCVIFKRMERRDLGAAHRFYCGSEPPAPHTASGDVAATMAVLAGQIDRYPDLPRGVDGLDELSRPRR